MTEEKALQSRVDRLEELSFFQEQTISELNSALTQQQNQIDFMEKRLALLEKKTKILWEQVGEDGGELTVPPHYL